MGRGWRWRTRELMALALASALGMPPTDSVRAEAAAHPWRTGPEAADQTLAARIPPPAGFARVGVAPASWGEWLRGLPLKPAGSNVRLYTGADKWRQDVQAAVIDIDVGNRDLQQCADAVMRLRAEWLWSAGRRGDIAFDYTDGGRVPFSRWAKGERPSQTGKSWRASGKADASYASFRKYMTQVFVYAGTYSLARELKPVRLEDIAIGDVLVKGGFPGHAVLVADLAANAGGEKRFLLVQSYMPAQDMHVLRNPADAAGSPWYALPAGNEIVTPEWTFTRDQLKRWP